MDARGEIGSVVGDSIGWLTMARPEKRNALTRAMWGAIPGVMHALAAREEIVMVALRGAEGTFGAGADLEDVLAATAGRSEAIAYATQVVAALLAVATSPLPTIALVEGVAAGGAAEIALACDLRFAEPDASFAFPFARLGIVPDRFTLRRLAALVGPSAARHLVLKGETIDASRALELGLVDEVVESGELAAVAREWAAPLGRASRRARAEMKRVLLEGEETGDVAALIGPMVESLVGGEVREAALRFVRRS